MAIEKKEECVGLFGPCTNEVTHHLEDPEGGPSVPLCEEHWQFSEELEKALERDPEFEKKFRDAVNKYRN